jgi:hypothetical protein
MVAKAETHNREAKHNQDRISKQRKPEFIITVPHARYAFPMAAARASVIVCGCGSWRRSLGFGTTDQTVHWRGSGSEFTKNIIVVNIS